MDPEKILFIRRDNIGDLVCTTPAIRAVRERFPRARISLLVNTYNADIVRDHPDIDQIYVFQKPKHAPGRWRWAVLWENFRLFHRIRRERYDVAIGCGIYNKTLSHYTFFTGARRRIGYVRDNAGRFFYNVPVTPSTRREHEVVKVFRLLAPLGITGEPGEMVLKPDAGEVRKFADFVAARRADPARPLLAVAISARIRRHQWPLENFMALIDKCLAVADVLILWAPGSQRSVTYPGDDEAAARVIGRFKPALLAYPTPTLKALVAALNGADAVLTLDTGNLHLASALHKPLLALMTERNVPLWAPWKTRSRLVTSPGDVADIGVEQVWPEVLSLLGPWRD
jgi:ADP-heptose:LPS heptosyltransferase